MHIMNDPFIRMHAKHGQFTYSHEVVPIYTCTWGRARQQVHSQLEMFTMPHVAKPVYIYTRKRARLHLHIQQGPTQQGSFTYTCSRVPFTLAHQTEPINTCTSGRAHFHLHTQHCLSATAQLAAPVYNVHAEPGPFISTHEAGPDCTCTPSR